MQKSSLLTRSLGAGLATLTLAFLAAAQSTPLSTDSIVVKSAPQTVLNGFDTKRATMQDLSLPRTSVDGFEIYVHMGGKVYELILRAHDVRAKNFKLIVSDQNGLHVVPTPPNTTYRGAVTSFPDSVIAASLVDGQLTAMVQLAGGESPWNIQPLTTVVKGANRTIHVMHQAKDNSVPQFKCGVNQIAAQAVPNRNPTGNAGVLVECEIGCDADFEEYKRHGSNVTNTQNDVAGIINACTVIYKRDVEVEYKITQTVVRTAQTYAASLNYSQLLSAYRNRWNASHGNIQRDISHLFTAKNRFSGVIGVAYLNGVCRLSVGYGLSYTHFTANYTSRVGLTAHELGHSFGSRHCSGSGCFIMCPGLGGCGRNLTLFGTTSKNAINAYKRTVSCLSPKQTNKPIISGISPATVQAFRGGTVTLTGSKFTGAFKVHVGALVLTPGTDPLRHFKLISATSIQFEAPTAGSLFPVPVRVETALGTSDPKSLGFKVTSPAKLDAYPIAKRGSLMLWEFGAGVADRWIMTVSLSPNTFNVLGHTWQATPLILSSGTLSFGGYGAFAVPQVPTSATVGLKFYSQVVTINVFFNQLAGNTNVSTTEIK